MIRDSISALGCFLDRARLWFALRAFELSRRTIGRIRGRRGRDFIGPEADIVDRCAQQLTKEGIR